MEKTTIERIEKMLPMLNEKERRRYLALEAKSIGYGGISQISRLTGVSRDTIILGCRELILIPVRNHCFEGSRMPEGMSNLVVCQAPKK